MLHCWVGDGDSGCYKSTVSYKIADTHETYKSCGSSVSVWVLVCYGVVGYFCGLWLAEHMWTYLYDWLYDCPRFSHFIFLRFWSEYTLRNTASSHKGFVKNNIVPWNISASVSLWFLMKKCLVEISSNRPSLLQTNIDSLLINSKPLNLPSPIDHQTQCILLNTGVVFFSWSPALLGFSNFLLIFWSCFSNVGLCTHNTKQTTVPRK